MVATEKQLNINDILNVQDTKTLRVDTPEWGGYVVIQTMTAESRDRYEISMLKSNGSGNIESNEDGSVASNLENARAKLVAACCLGPDGRLMFKNDEHVKILGQKSAVVVDRIYSACLKLNAVSNAEIEEIAGN